jgi:hypothetical protein
VLTPRGWQSLPNNECLHREAGGSLAQIVLCCAMNGCNVLYRIFSIIVLSYIGVVNEVLTVFFSKAIEVNFASAEKIPTIGKFSIQVYKNRPAKLAAIPWALVCQILISHENGACCDYQESNNIRHSFHWSL